MEYQRIRSYRDDLLQRARSKIQRQMLAAAISNKMTIEKHGKRFVVQTFEQIGQSWKTDGSYDNARKFFNATYQLYDNRPELLEQIEIEFMRGRFTYDKVPTEKHQGCVMEIIKSQKRYCIRQINDRSAKTHERRLTITRDGFPEEERFKKRKRGVFDDDYVKLYKKGDTGRKFSGPFIADSTSSPSSTSTAATSSSDSSVGTTAVAEVVSPTPKKGTAFAEEIPCSASSVSTISTRTPPDRQTLLKANQELRRQMKILTEKQRALDLETERKARDDVIKAGTREARAAVRKNQKAKASATKTKSQKKTTKKEAREPDPFEGQDPNCPIMQRRRYQKAKHAMHMEKVVGIKDAYEKLGVPRGDNPPTPPGLQSPGSAVVDVESACGTPNSFTSDSSHQELAEDSQANQDLLEKGTSIVEILGRYKIGRQVFLKVKWDTGGVQKALMKDVKLDAPELVKEFCNAERKKRKAVSDTPAKKKPRVEDQLQSPGRCNCDHDDVETFVAEDDPRYWQNGCMYDGKMCDKCNEDSKPASQKKPSYKCVDALKTGCLEVRCNSCYVKMIMGENDE